MQSAELPFDGRGALDPACRAWREEGAALETGALAMLRLGDTYAPYLEVVPGTAKEAREAVEAVRESAEAVCEALMDPPGRVCGFWRT